MQNFGSAGFEGADFEGADFEGRYFDGIIFGTGIDKRRELLYYCISTIVQ
jgi:uncharacterized protein YjbI with pentapeptide repeats